MGKPMFPHAVDSTILAAFRSCPQKAYQTYVRHWKPKAESVHLVAGGAFAKGIEVARREYFEGSPPGCQFPNGREVAEAAGMRALLEAYGDFECPPDSAKSCDRTAGALEFYFDRYPLGEDGMVPITWGDGRRGIEFSFALPIPGTEHPTSGAPILYTGRADMIADFAGGVYIVDEKTTSQLGATWPNQWELRSQFTGYCWAAREHGIAVDGAVVRGISILKTKYDTAHTLTRRPAWEVDRWLLQVQRDLARMIQCWRDGWWDYNLDNACSEYGGCHLKQICKSPDPETWLPMSYEKRVWDPLARKELSVEEWEASWGHESVRIIPG